MRVTAAPGRLQTDRRQHRRHALAPLVAIADAVDLQAFFQGAADAPPGIERRAGILVDVLDHLARAARRFRRQAAYRTAVEQDLAGALALQAKDGAAESGLAAAQFAHQRQDLAFPKFQADFPYRLHRRRRLAQKALAAAQLHGDLMQGEDRRGAHAY